MEKPLVDVLWILICAALVFLMQPGFMCLESGLTRSKNSINVAAKNLADFVFSALSFWAIGYGLMFGAEYSGIIGTNSFFPSIDSSAYMTSFFIFQTMFCGTATTIFSGAIAERMSFGAYLIVAEILSVLVYPVFGNWAWNGLETGEMLGWLGSRGFIDFAGSTVVHSVGGWVALAALLVVGPRKGRFTDDNKVREMNPSDLPMSVLGTLLLWFGWFGFNGGSTLTMDASVPMIIANTTLAGVAGGATCTLLGWYDSKIPKVNNLINGSLGGLVAITANCHVVTAADAVIIGAFAGPLCIWLERLLEKAKIDDAVGAVPVHLGCGIWGTLAVALFGKPDLIGTGLNMYDQFVIQLTGIFAAFVVAFLFPYIILTIINRFLPLRVTPEEEEVGLNVSEHGAHTDLLDLFQTMELQASTQDLSLRIPVEPFTEVGRIATCYNQVISALEESVSKTEAIIHSATDGIMTFSRDSLELLQANPRAREMFALPGVGALDGVQFTDLVDSDAPLTETLFSSRSVELNGNRINGNSFPVEAVITPAKGMPFYMAIMRDITERKEAERKLLTQQAYFQQLFESSPQAIVQVNTRGKIQNVNKGFEQLFGFKRKEVLGSYNRSVVVPHNLQAEAKQFSESVLTGRLVDKETVRRHKDGRLIPISVIGYPIHVEDEVRGIYYIYTDITQRKAFEDQLAHQAFHDSLTGLPNRVLFAERLSRALKRSKRRKDYRFAAMMLDMDRFKWINDTLGHHAGDEFLIAIADRISSCIREVDTVARLGGDEFGIVVEEFSSYQEVIKIAKRIQHSLQLPLDLAEGRVTSSASIGIVLRSEDYDDSEAVMRDADIAMYRAKEMGRSRFKVFNQRMHSRLLAEVELENDLRQAIQDEELSLFYQPIMHASSGQLRGFEALLRWDSPQRGMVSPAEIIPLAEETGLIVPLGQWILREACLSMKKWLDSTGIYDLTINVNLSFKQFGQPNFTQFVKNTLEQTKLPPKNLKLELTESCLMQNPAETMSKLTTLRKMGVQLVIDDFGTGYSSLSYLQRFPIDGLKIDRSFISGDSRDTSNKEIVRTIIAMAKSLGLDVVAEGVEESSQLDMLQDMSCDAVQGFMFSRPVEGSKVENFINNNLSNTSHKKKS
ncbi:ammonium transporter [Maridesulfovibrio sp.]|uniref:ammonium transporter n=1 Tax=Maridesulfovibrio sp. TaxID=2795000 RepID=UPI0029CA87CC|nr:ammonium transporter [Maridesulfovibrio sp.]